MDNPRSSPDPAASALLKPAEVARRLGVSPSTLRTWDRRLHVVKLPSGHRRYRLEDVERIERGA
jgi:DNA-binding transcriptional MerR regulator